jgi:tetratricopeptide (TPR) repeat protein
MPKQFISAAGTAGTGEARLAFSKKLGPALLRIAEWLTLCAAIVTPLFYLPAASQALEFPKQLILLALVSLALLAWTGSMLVNRAIVLRRTVANPIVIILLLATAVSAFASSARFVSLVGDGGQEYQSLLTTALFCCLFFLVANVPEERPFAKRALSGLTLVGGLICLLSILQYAGVPAIPFVSSAGFNLVGSTVLLGLVSAIVVVMSASSFLFEESGKLGLFRRIVSGVAGVCALLTALIIDFWPVWVAAIIGLLFILIYAVVRPQAVRRLAWLAVPMGCLIISALMLLVNARLPVSAPVEIFPSLSQSFKVTRDTLVSHPVFGSGPGTYAQDFSAHRGPELNQSPLWYLVFDRGTSYLLTAAATVGLAGLVAWLAILIVGVWKSIAFLSTRKKDETAWLAALGIASAWLASAAGLVIYGTSLTSLLIFWLLFGLLIRATTVDSVEVKFASSPRTALVMTFTFVIVVVLALSSWFVSGTRLYADAVFAKSASLDIKDIDKVVSGLEKALSVESQSAVIARNLSQADLVKIQQLVNDQKMDAAQRGQQVQAFASEAIRSAKLATEAGPENADNWSQLGTVYESISGFVDNAPDQALIAYERAAELAPTSPIYPTAIGRVHLAIASLVASESEAAKDEAAKKTISQKVDEALNKAEAALNKALALKSDYAVASYQLALVKESQGKTAEAIVKLQEVEAMNPSDSGVSFQLAVLYYRDSQKEKAQAELERTIEMLPTFANARWLLATIYEEQKRWDDALTQLGEILKNNPDSTEVQDKIKAVEDEKAGKTPASVPGQASVLPEGGQNNP